MNKCQFFLLTLLCFNVHRLTPAETEEAVTKKIDDVYNDIVKTVNNDPLHINSVWPYCDHFISYLEIFLARAIENNEFKVVKFFLHHKVRVLPHLLSPAGKENYNLIISQQINDEKLLEAAFEGNLENVEQALKDGAYINVQTFERKPSPDKGCCLDTPLIRLMNSDNPDKGTIYKILEILLKHKADPNISNQYGGTPLTCTGRYDFLSLLLKNGANPNISNPIRNLLLTPDSYESEIKLLLSYGALIPKGLNSKQRNLIEKLKAEIRETNDQSLAIFLQTPQDSRKISTKKRYNVNEVIKKLMQPEIKPESKPESKYE